MKADEQALRPEYFRQHEARIAGHAAKVDWEAIRREKIENRRPRRRKKPMVEQVTDIAAPILTESVPNGLNSRRYRRYFRAFSAAKLQIQEK